MAIPTLPSPPPDSAAQKNCAPSTPPADVPESDLARALGVSRGDLKKLRAQLTSGVDWKGGSGAPIVITAAGQARLQQLLAPDPDGAGDGTASDVDAAVAALQSPDRYAVLIVAKIGGARVLIARAEDDPTETEPVRVMVKSSGYFLPGMRLEKCEPSRTEGVYFYHGRMPRQKGRW